MEAIESRDIPSDSARSESPLRRQYVSPCLVVYGTLADLTGATGNDEFDGVIGSGDVS
jgi:hypothetical protein